MPVCAFSPKTALFLGFSVFHGAERNASAALYVYAVVAAVVKSDTPNLQSLKSMAIVERFNSMNEF